MLPSNPPDASKNPQHIAPKGDKRSIVELLPLEVIEYIFEIGTRAEREGKRWRRPPFPERVSHVCRRWRSIAIDMSILWTKLSFTEDRPSEKKKVWLERTKKAPLDLSIDWFPVEDGIDVVNTEDQGDENQEDRSDMAERHFDRTLDLIIPHVSRWRSFHLVVNRYKFMHSALERLGKCPTDPGAPILQTLFLCCSGNADEFAPAEYFERYFPFGGHAPMLTRVDFKRVHIDWKLLIPPLERCALSSLYSTPTFTTNLTDLNFAYHSRDVRPSYEEFITILRCAPNLSSLEFCISSPAPRQQGPVAQPIFLPKLRKLHLMWIGEEDACAILRTFYAPALRNITLYFDRESYDAFVRQLAAPMPLPNPQSPNFRDLIFLPPSPGDDPNSSSLPEEGEESGRFVDPREPKSILHNVTEVTLLCIDCLTDGPQHFYSASPNLKRLSLKMNNLPLEFFSVFMEDPAVPGCQGGGSNTSLSLSSTTSAADLMTPPGTPLCKRLESLDITGIPACQLIPFVRKRKAQGIPIRELIIRIEPGATVTGDEESWLIANVKTVKIVDSFDFRLLHGF